MFQLDIKAAAAIFADEVYHSVGDIVFAPPGWTEIDRYYDPQTGYFGEAWGLASLDADGAFVPGQYSAIIVANRGTVFSQPADGSLPPLGTSYPDSGPVNLGQQYSNDYDKTVNTDVSNIEGASLQTLGASAEDFLSRIETNYGTTPIYSTGQSLGNVFTIAQGALAVSQGFSNYAGGFSFNGLPVNSNQLASFGLTAQQSQKLNDLEQTIYTGDEVLTQNLALSFLQSVFNLGGSTVGTPVVLPAPDPSVSPNSTIIDEHNPDNAVASIFDYLYPVGTASRQEALAALQASYPDPAQTPATVQAVLSGQPYLSPSSLPPLPLTPDQLGTIFGSTLGSLLVSGNSLEAIPVTSALSVTIGSAVSVLRASALVPNTDLSGLLAKAFSAEAAPPTSVSAPSE